jgi:DNA-binding Lrp family transcriptional regulator
MEVSIKNKEILYLLESNAGLSFKAIAELGDTEEYTVRRTFHRFVEMKIITGRAVFVDSMLLGYDDYALFLSLKSMNAIEQTALLNSFKESPLTRWLADVGGTFDYAITLLSRTSREVRQFLDRLSEKHQDAFVAKELSLRTYMMRYPRRFLAPSLKGCDTYVMGNRTETAEIDDLDRKILNHMSRGHFTSDNQLATELGVSGSTIVRRVAGLQQSGVLLGATYRIDSALLGYCAYRVLITMKRLGADLRRRIIQFCDKELSVRIMVETLGSWDYELELELAEGRQIKQFTGRLYEAFPNEINALNVIPIFQHLSYAGFPVES